VAGRRSQVRARLYVGSGSTRAFLAISRLPGTCPARAGAEVLCRCREAALVARSEAAIRSNPSGPASSRANGSLNRRSARSDSRAGTAAIQLARPSRSRAVADAEFRRGAESRGARMQRSWIGMPGIRSAHDHGTVVGVRADPLVHGIDFLQR
jgi:hypothetical protein